MKGGHLEPVLPILGSPLPNQQERRRTQMIQYLQLLQDVIDLGVDIQSRNAPVRSIHGYQIKYDLEEGFPLLTTKKMDFNVIKAELLGFIRAYDHVEQFQELGCNIWNANAEDFDRDGYLGPIYGVQWRKWTDWYNEKHIDQLQNCIDNIKNDPFSRRHIVSALAISELDRMCLPPCHVLFQFHVRPNILGKPEYLSLSMYQRSCDVFLGVPFNIASYSLLLSIVARMTDLRPLHFIHSMGDVHLYHDHFDVARIQTQRTPGLLPTLNLARREKIEDYQMDDIELFDYKCDGRLKAKMIV